jgi:RHS repeat-associated protein
MTQFGYDVNGNLLTRTDANSYATTFTYDVLNRMKTRTLPGGGAVESLAYNLTGTLANVTDFNGKITTFSYDAMNRLITRTPTGETAVSYTYTPTGQRQTMTDGSGSTSYAYDNQNRLVSKTASAGALSYTYDAAGDRLTAVSSNAGGTNVTFTYDALSRLQTVVDKGVGGSANPATYTYDAVGNLTSVALPNGVTVTPGYDTMYRVKSLAATSAPAAAYSYTYGPVGNRLSAQDGNGSAAYTYSSIYRLTEESIARGQTAGSLAYGLDPVGNRLSLTSGITAITSQAFTYTPNDRIMADSYDTNGNLLAAGGNTYAYDSQNRLTSFNAGAATFVYDGDGNRVAKTSGGVTTQYLVDDANPTGLAQVAEEVVNGAVTRRYVYGLGRISQTQAAGTSYYGYDAHGDVRTLMDGTGVVTDTYDYDAFGNVIASTGTTANVYRYQGEALDAETGLYYLRARYYDSITGRFLSVDPLADQGEHPYAYSSANPVDGHDPTGLQDVFEYKALLVGPLTWPHFSLAMAAGGGHSGGGSGPGGGGSGSGDGPGPGCMGGGGGGALNAQAKLDQVAACKCTPDTCDKLGIGIEEPKPSAVTNGVLNVADDPGHTFVYLMRANGKFDSMLSFGPGAQITWNKDLFRSGMLPGNVHWPLKGLASTWESYITSDQLNSGSQAIANFKAQRPRYTPTFNCTFAALSIAKGIGLTLPDGVGPVEAIDDLGTRHDLGDNQFTRRIANPYQLTVEMKQQFGPPSVVNTGIFPDN